MNNCIFSMFLGSIKLIRNCPVYIYYYLAYNEHVSVVNDDDDDTEGSFALILIL